MDREFILLKLKQHKADFKNLGVMEIGLFGSYIRGEQTPESDIDFLIDFLPSHENYDNYLAAFDLIEKLFHGTKVEVVTKNGLSPYIGKTILNNVVYA